MKLFSLLVACMIIVLNAGFSKDGNDIPAHQAEITFNSGEIFAVGPWFSTEFKVTYRRRRTGEWIEAKGALFCETDGEKVTEMRMYWHRR